MINIFDSWEFVLFALDSATALIVFYYYKSKSSEIDILTAVPTFEIDNNLNETVRRSKNGCLPYICVKGVVKASNSIIKSNYTNYVGVVQDTSVYEHKSRRIQARWFNEVEEVSNFKYSVPFSLYNPSSKNQLEVKHPLSSEYLLPSLSVVYDSFEPVKSSSFNKVVDVIAGNVTQGFSTTERMLGITVPLTAFGMVKLNKDNNLILKPPTSEFKYILTTMSKKEFLNEASKVAEEYKYLTYIFISIGAIFLSLWLKKIYKRIKESEERKRINDDIANRHISNIKPEESNSNCCVVCLYAQRNVLLLPCRHIATCSECIENLLHPKLCPICRIEIKTYMPVYLP